MLNRTFGIEIEITGMDRQRAAQILNIVGLSAMAEGYNHQTRAHWKVVADSSVPGGCEVVSPPLRGEEGLEQVRTAITALDDAGAKISVSCGLHVHFDASGLTASQIRNLVTRYARFENEIDRFMPPSRRGDANQYCKSLRAIARNREFQSARTIDDMVRAQGSRYFKINLQSYHRHGTIEFRQHSGTVNAPKALNWIRFLDAFIEASKTEECRQPQAVAAFRGKNATLVELMRREQGATTEDLTEATGWQRHTVRAAITRIRQTGTEVVSARRNGLTCYRLASDSLLGASDSLFRGISQEIERFYKNRAAVLAA
ncbi:putative amidoligase enzyme [anaerobic digester metagenome]